NEEYYGVNAFVFSNKAGARQAVRYQLVPEHLVHLSASDAAKQAPNFLMDELPERLKHGPITFHLKAQLAAAGASTQGPVSSLAGRPQSRGAGRFDGRQSSARQC